jgi:hypothetical protein
MSCSALRRAADHNHSHSIINANCKPLIYWHILLNAKRDAIKNTI